MKASDIARFTAKNTLPVLAFDTVPSTNDVAREQTGDCAVVSETQTAGRGRKGRTFVSQTGGLYLSIAREIRSLSPDLIPLLTVFSCVAVCRAIEKTCGISAEIKWVNDLLVNGKKVCGILAESALGARQRVILGIGINVFTPSQVLSPFGAASLLPRETPLIRERLAAAVLDELADWEENCRNNAWIEEYRRRSAVLGNEIRCFVGNEEFCAVAEEITDRGGLIVRLDNGERRTLCSGEITVRLK